MYHVLIGGLFLLRWVFGRSSQSNRITYLFVLIGILIFSAFRFRVGCDWSGYYNNFVVASSMNYQEALEQREPMWWITQITLARWDLPYPSINVLTSAVFFIGIHALGKRQPDPLGFLVLLFPILVINMPMSGIRQGVAIGCLCLAFASFIDRRPLIFLFWLGLGSTFHNSALSFLFLAPMATKVNIKIRVLSALLLGILSAYFVIQSEAAQIALQRYINSELDANGAVFRVSLLTLTGLLYVLFLWQKWRTRFPLDFGLSSISAMMMIGMPLTIGFSSVIADRIGYYLVPIQTMILSRLFFLVPRPVRKVSAAIPYIALFLVFTVWSMLSDHFRVCYIPYRSWLFGNDEFGVIGL